VITHVFFTSEEFSDSIRLPVVNAPAAANALAVEVYTLTEVIHNPLAVPMPLDRVVSLVVTLASLARVASLVRVA
jgi:hypothetical protein